MALGLEDVKQAARENKVKTSGMGGKKTLALKLAYFRQLPSDPSDVPSPDKPASGTARKGASLAPKKTIAKSSKPKPS